MTERDKLLFRAGLCVLGPNGGGYIARRDVRQGEIISVGDFSAYGTASKPVKGEPLPDWLHKLAKSL